MLRFIFNLVLSCLVIIVVIGAVLALYILPGLPDIETLKDIRMQVPLRIYTKDLSLISEFGEKRRTPVKINDVPEQLIDAFIATEDNRFYQHPGVDWQGILRAAVNLIKTGKKSQGGSTITMQVARNFFLSREKSYLRKINEIFLAFKIESQLSKDDILELYLNKIYMGQRAYGVGAAAQVYYGSNVKELTLAQLAMIAGLPKAPSTTNPISNPERAIARRNFVLQRMLDLGYIDNSQYTRAINSPVTASLHSPDTEVEAPYIAEMVRQYLLEKYGEDIYIAGYKVITTIGDNYQTAANQALRKALLDYDERHGYRGPERHYELPADADEHQWNQLLEGFPVIGELYPALVLEVREQSATAFLTGIGLIDIEWDGLKWARLYKSENHRGPEPENAGDILQAGDVIRIIEDIHGQWKLTQIPAVEGAIVSLDPEDGAVLALVGGFDFQRSKFNRVTQALRQPGSSFKPFIYSAALHAGYTAASIINDAPVVFDDPGIEDIWRPENYSNKYYGPTRLRVALRHSRNLVSIRLLHGMGVNTALEHIAKFGFDTEQLPHNLSLALGSGSVSPWQLADSYSVFANGGYDIEPYYIDRIETYTGDLHYKANPIKVCAECKDEQVMHDGEQSDNAIEETTALPVPATGNTDMPALRPDKPDINNFAKRVVDPQNIWIMNSLTRDVIQNGTGRKALVLNRADLSGKTGTTNDQRDAWFAGFNTSIVTISWVGFDNFQPLGRLETGARAALPMWIDYMRDALKDVPESIMERPAGLVNVRIDPATGKLATADNPDAIFEVFRSDHVPKTGNITGEDIFINEKSEGKIPEQLF